MNLVSLSHILARWPRILADIGHCSVQHINCLYVICISLNCIPTVWKLGGNEDRKTCDRRYKDRLSISERSLDTVMKLSLLSTLFSVSALFLQPTAALVTQELAARMCDMQGVCAPALQARCCLNSKLCYCDGELSTLMFLQRPMALTDWFPQSGSESLWPHCACRRMCNLWMLGRSLLKGARRDFCGVSLASV